MSDSAEQARKDEAAMRLALDQAQNAWLVGEVPVGAVIVREVDGVHQVVATGYNRPITTHDPTAHARSSRCATPRSCSAITACRTASCT
ncbi:tRNA-specific adenosine deaminase [Methylibium sp. T29-B]|nr:tRNA-specific adenosine deaminase [Methylibium sp. T29-B]